MPFACIGILSYLLPTRRDIIYCYLHKMADRIENCNRFTEPTALSTSVYSPNSIHSCYDDSGFSPKKYRSGSLVHSTSSLHPSTPIDVSCSVLKRRCSTHKFERDTNAATRSTDPITLSLTSSSAMLFQAPVHEGQGQSKGNQILAPQITKLRRDHLYPERPLLSQEDHVSPLCFNAEMLQLLHLSQSNTTPTRERVRRSHRKVSTLMPVFGKLSKWSNKYKHHDSSYSCIDSMRRIFYRAAQQKARDIIRRQTHLINRFLNSHIDTTNLDGQEHALLDLTASQTKYGHIIWVITFLMKKLPDHLKKDLMSKGRTDLMKIGVNILEQAIGAHD